jgi:excisionase family DNA binding protein
MERLYTIAQVADLLQTGKNNVRAKIYDKKLAAINIGEGKRADYRVPETDLKRFLRARGYKGEI